MTCDTQERLCCEYLIFVSTDTKHEINRKINKKDEQTLFITAFFGTWLDFERISVNVLSSYSGDIELPQKG